MRSIPSAALVIGMAAASPALALQASYYSGSNVTGQLVLTRTVNPIEVAQRLRAFGAATFQIVETKPRMPPKRLRPPLLQPTFAPRLLGAPAMPSMQTLPAVFPSNILGFNGLTHASQRLANGGNQFSIEPPNPSVAVGNGYIVEGVNNAFQVFTVGGVPLLPTVLSTNELFGVPAAIDRTTGVNGVYPTDMRVFYDHRISRWFVLQRAQDNDRFGNPLNSSHLYIAVSQTANPVGTYNIYEMDTTNGQNPGCPCLADYPQIGADQHGFYISVNEFDTYSLYFVDAAILAVSKAALATGAKTPPMYRFLVPLGDGFGFAIQPASTPPGASYFLASGGLEYFVSSQASYSTSSGLAIWAMYNTGSLNNPNPAPLLTRITSPTLTYYYPDVATQRNGPLPYGSSLVPPGALAYLDGGDTRVQSVSYAGGRLYVSLASGVLDDTGRNVVGGAYVIFSPTFRNNVLAAPILRQGYVAARSNHLLRPAIAVNSYGRGAIAFTLVGPGYYPSAAFLPIDTFSTAPAIQVAALGASPEDGFTGYPGGFAAGVARWGDYSTAVADSDGSIWMVVEHIPNAPRTEFANWGTFVSRYIP